MPEYRSHKHVWALKIGAVDLMSSSGEARITPDDTDFQPFVVNAVYVQKHNPQPGGYFVQYGDGYISWSPAEAFETGYSPVGSEKPKSIRAKMRLNNIFGQAWGGAKVIFHCAYDPAIPEDQSFSKATPNGVAEFQIDNEAASGRLTIGKSYYFDITEVPDGP